ncbi:MAG: hypothetical protein MMC33_001737 [Icmadophila ericetorum]|nr:hypothetical protein [Icmadophila ericetorum]
MAPLPTVIDTARPLFKDIEEKLKKYIRDLRSQVRHLPQDVGILNSALEAELEDGLNDDRNYLVERIIQLASQFPDGAPSADVLTSAFIRTLWDNLQHPPLSYVGDGFKYRAADGSGNNVMYPDLGKAGSVYARSVTPQHRQLGLRPDPTTIFDTLFARNGSAKEHPNKISSVLFYLATIIIHDLFRTGDKDPSKHANSAYLDLGPLYGHNQAQQDAVRTFKDGTLKPDTFSEPRILGQPPGVGALLVCFNRFHNYVVGQLAAIDEYGKFSLPTWVTPEHEGYEAAQRKRDNDLFQTGRLVTCGLYVNIILGDYVTTILNLNRSNTTWRLDPRKNFNDIFDVHGTPQGIGNQVSVEFNLIYRWHSATSSKDEKWAQEFFGKLFPGKKPTTISLADFRQGLQKWAHSISKDPGKWTFNGFKRTANGSYADADILKCLVEGTEDIAGAFGAQNVPTVLKLVEVMGIEQARDWQVATLNELRKFFGMTPHKTFEDITKNPEVAATLETLYGHPDNVELYPGVVVEDAKEPLAPGSGLCPGYTVSRAILSDAVALVRSDRFYTVDYSPANLTSWGFNEVSTDLKIAQGGVMYKLLMRALPGYYRSNSVYAMYPFTIPSENERILRNLGVEADYDFTPPSFVGPPLPVVTWVGATEVLNDQANFKVPWGPHIYDMTHHDFMLGGDKKVNAEQRKFVQSAVFTKPEDFAEIREFYEMATTKLVREQSKKLGGYWQLDAVRDVGNPSHANFAAHLFGISESFKDKDKQLYGVLATLFTWVFLDLDPVKTYGLRLEALDATAILTAAVQKICNKVKEKDSNSDLEGKNAGLTDYGARLVERLFKDGKSVDEVVNIIIPTAAAAVGTQAQGIAQILDLFLSPLYSDHWRIIQRLANSDSPESFEKLIKYGLEAFRLSTPAYGVVRACASEHPIMIHDGEERTVTTKAGDLVYVDFSTSSRDPSIFPNPLEIDLNRPDTSYIHFGWGKHACLGRPIAEVAMAAQLKVFAKLKNLRRARGAQGQMKSGVVPGTDIRAFMSEDWGSWSPLPASLKVEHDGFVAEGEGEGLVSVANGQEEEQVVVVSNGNVKIANGTGNGHVNGGK